MAFFRKITPNVIEDPEELSPFNHDWTHKYTGASRLAIQPSEVSQLQAIIKYCNERRLAVVPQGGNTGLVGGGVPVFDEIIVSLSKLDKIIEFDPISSIFTVEAGCILENADHYLRERGHLMPLDLGAKGSCQIGGNLATNAGGIRLLRYGTLPGNTTGLQAVLANGSLMNVLSKNRKDNTGYSLKHLMIGSEGTLGIITAVNILCPPAPTSINAALFSVDSFDKIPQILSQARKSLGEILSAFEFWDSGSQMLLGKHMKDVPMPLNRDSPFYVLIETHGSDVSHDQEKISGLIEKVSESGLVEDGVLAQDQGQIDRFWRLREGIPEVCSKEGVVYKYDVTMHPADIYRLVEDMRARLRNTEATSVIGYGHVGDGNVHLNIAAPKLSPHLEDMIEPYVYQYVIARGGSISAEHGLGVMKANFLPMAKDPVSLDLMRRIKNEIDPKGILNPYKVLPTTIGL